MKSLQKFIYIVVSLRTDLKKVDLINAKVSEYQKEKNNIQNKIDIQNGLYTETIKEKYVEQRRELQIEKTNTLKNQLEKNQERIEPTSNYNLKDICKWGIDKDSRTIKESLKYIQKCTNYFIKDFQTQEKLYNIENEKQQDEEME